MRVVPAHSLYRLLMLFVWFVPGCTSSPPGSESTHAAGGPTITMQPHDPFSIALGSTDTVSAVVTGMSSSVKFTSSAPGVVSVNSATGVIQGVSVGTATITATATANPEVRSSVMVTVSTSIAFVPGESSEALEDFIGEVCANKEEADSLAIDADIPMIHEFHDCQRLISNDQYQPVTGIFAHRNVASRPSPEQWGEGRLAAIIINFKTKNQRMSYAPLDLQFGTSCLVLKWTRGRGDAPRDPGTWEAAVVHVTAAGRPYGNCSDDMTWSDVPDSKKGIFEVRPQLNAAAYDPSMGSPPVARWDWDARRGENYIGVGCGSHGWCEVGKKGFTPLPAIKTRNGKNLYKGLYDEQYLADSTGAKSPVWGTLTPGTDAIRVGTVQRNNRWYEVARIDLNAAAMGAPPKAFAFYRDRLALKSGQTASGKVRATGSLRISSPPLPNVPPPQLAGLIRQNPDLKNWNVQVNGRSVAGGRMTHRGHPSEGLNRFGTVRWRWNEEDETVWTYCPEDGCCELRRLY